MKKIFASTVILGLFISFPLNNIEAKVKATKVVTPAKPSALCKDGTYSYSKTRKGTCSYHKGVKVWYK